MWTKICANTNLADAQLAVELGAHAVGFVFAPSRRQVSVEQVAEITAGLPDTVERVGVFATQSAEEIVAAVRVAGLTGVQLHSAYDPKLIKRLTTAFEGRIRLIQVVSVPVGDNAPLLALRSTLQRTFADSALWAVLLDAARAGASGGLGLSFSWERVRTVVDSARERGAEVARESGVEERLLIVAGGLHAGNVHEAICVLRPFGVDVASGVESYPGQKDPKKLAAFLEAARAPA